MSEEKGAAGKRTGVATSLRVSRDGLSLWDQLAAREGLNRTAYLEMTMRRLAAEKGIKTAETSGQEGETSE